MKRGYLDIPEGQLHYRSEGKGDVIMLLHMAASSGAEFDRMIPYLSPKYRAIAIDFPGYGESDPTPRNYLIEDFARVVLSAMDALKVKKAIIAGHHVGAEVALEVAATHPERVSRLILSCLTFFRTEQEFIAHSSKQVFQPVTIRPDGSHLMEWWRRATRYGDSIEIASERALDYHKAGGKEDLHDAAFAYIPRIREKLALIKCPTLVLAGSKDHYAPVQPDIQKLIPGSKLKIIQGGPVLLSRAMPTEFAGAILEFLNEPAAKKR